MANSVGNVTENKDVDCFSFDPRKGLTKGIQLITGMPTLRNNGTFQPPHIRCGDEFLGINKFSAPVTEQRGGQMFVLFAEHHQIFPKKENSDPFWTLSAPKSSYASAQLVSITTTMVQVAHVTEKFNPNIIRAWAGIIPNAPIEKLFSDDFSGTSVLKFTQDGQEVDIFLKNGMVYRIARENRKISLRLLSWKEAAEARVDQFDTQLGLLSTSEVDTKRTHGIIAGALRLLHLTKNEPSARLVLTSFLRKHVDILTSRMREEVRALLLAWNDKAAAFFATPEMTTILDLSALSGKFKVNGTSPKGPPADEKKRKQDRADRDREERAAMKGSSNGGGKQKKQAGKK